MSFLRWAVPFCIFGSWLPNSTEAALVTGPWTFNGAATGILNDDSTASPIVGNGTSNSAGNKSIDSQFPLIELAEIGDKITLSGSVTFTGITNSADQFRFGLFKFNDATTDDTGWRGYYLSNNGNTGNGFIRDKSAANTHLYSSGGSGGSVSNLEIITGGTGFAAFNDGTYAFSLTFERVDTGLAVSGSLTNGSSYSLTAGPATDTTNLIYEFDAVGFLFGTSLTADHVAFSNIDVTFTAAIPEPTTIAAFVLSAGAFWRIRQRKI